MTVDTQKYWNTTVILKEAEPAVGSRFTTSPKSIIEATKPYTKDAGKSWHIDEVTFLPQDSVAVGQGPKTPTVKGQGLIVHVQ